MSSIETLAQKLNLSAKHRLVIENMCWAVAGKSANIASGLLVGVFVARYLGPSNYGVMSYVISYVTLFSILATFGLDHIEIRELSKKIICKEKLIGTAFVIRLILAVVTMLIILLTLLKCEKDVFTIHAIMIYSLSLLLSSFNVIRNYFTSIVQNKYVVKAELLRVGIGAAIKLALLTNRMSLIWFVIAMTFDFALIGSGYIYSYGKKSGSLWKWEFDMAVARSLLSASFPLLLSGAAIVVYQKIDQVMIRNMIDSKAAGQFAVASAITDFIIFIPNVLAQTVTPLLVQSHQEEPCAYEQKKQGFLDVMLWSSVLIASIFSLSASPIISMLYGDEYALAIPVLQIMAWKAVFVGLASSSGQLIIIENIQKYAALRNITGCMVSVALNLALIPRWGINGSAAATIATMFFAGYFSHLFIGPYRCLFRLQTSAMFSGWKRIVKFRSPLLG